MITLVFCRINTFCLKVGIFSFSVLGLKKRACTAMSFACPGQKSIDIECWILPFSAGFGGFHLLALLRLFRQSYNIPFPFRFMKLIYGIRILRLHARRRKQDTIKAAVKMDAFATANRKTNLSPEVQICLSKLKALLLLFFSSLLVQAEILPYYR